MPGAVAGVSYLPAVHICWMQAGSVAGHAVPTPCRLTSWLHHEHVWRMLTVLPSLDFLTSAPFPSRGPGQCKLSAQALSGQARRSHFDCWGLEEFWGVGGFTTHVSAWSAASSALHHSGCRGGCSDVGPPWLVPFGVKLFMIHVLPWHHFPLKTWASDPACLPPNHLAKHPAACLPFTSNLCADSATCHQPLLQSPLT